MLAVLFGSSCTKVLDVEDLKTTQESDILNFQITPQSKFDKNGLMFSDQGAWFGFSFPNNSSNYGSFSGPFLMTQQNGIWSSQSLVKLNLYDDSNKKLQYSNHFTRSYNSHLEQRFTSNQVRLKQELVFASGHSAVLKSTISNHSNKTLNLSYNWSNLPLMAEGLSLSKKDHRLMISSSKTTATGALRFPESTEITIKNNSYTTGVKKIRLKPNAQIDLVVTYTFIFPEYALEKEFNFLKQATFEDLLKNRIEEKETQLKALAKAKRPSFSDSIYDLVLAKAHLTLQNNWRIPAGEIQHEGLFPSYHYQWFNGFWSWDSWKHSVGLSYFNSDLAKKQMKLMFEFQREDGFVADCVYRDTTIEAHNYRDTKPPLAAWAVSKIFDKDPDKSFLQEIYPKLKKYHQWWYQQRDHDNDGLCEYGSTDGTLIAAKWESGMDNAIRFDQSKILKNEDGAYSLDQESVDLNAYLFAEKKYLASLAKDLQLFDDAAEYLEEAEHLKAKIQTQFYNHDDGWFYDTNLDGTVFIKGAGSEGWTALWALAASKSQAEAVISNMVNPKKFYTKVPFQTMSADHPKFDPMKGYWRGPNWLDQSYFGIKSLRNYGYSKQADEATKRLLKGGKGIIKKGPSIRENYHPLTGEGLYAQNFSWSAAHIIMMLMDD